ncbi:MAG: PadR family transcriptional regulator, partial [Gemmatimonadaceae bacterium]
SIFTRTSNGEPMARPPIELLRGSLDAIILKTLTSEPMHGLAIARWLRQISDDALQLEEGSLYPALYRMENRGWIRSVWRTTENNRRAKYYELTAAGRRQLRTELMRWDDFVSAVSKVFAANPVGYDPAR